MLQVSLSTRQVFQQDDMEHMTKQERRFAEEQLRSIFSHEMSKVSMTLEHKREVSSKLLKIEQQKEQHLQQTYDRLSQRMSRVDHKRQEQIKRRIETCKTHDEEWRTKISTIEKKLKKESKQAETRAKKFRLEHDEYIRKKQQLAKSINQKRSSIQSNRSNLGEPSYRMSLVEPIKNVPKSPRVQYLTSRTRPMPTLSHSRNKLDESIRTHKQRSSLLQFHQQQAILAKALDKLDTINQRRKKLISMHETARSEAEEKRQAAQSLRSLAHTPTRRSESPKDRVRSISVIDSSRKSIKPERLIDHLTLKKKRELKEFRERGEILQKSTERNKKEYILKQIRQKVNEYKMLAQRPS